MARGLFFPGEKLKSENKKSIDFVDTFVIEPKEFKDSTIIVDNLVENKDIVIDLSNMISVLNKKEEALRLIDYVCGATYALHKKIKKIGSSKFSITN